MTDKTYPPNERANARERLRDSLADRAQSVTEAFQALGWPDRVFLAAGLAGLLFCGTQIVHNIAADPGSPAPALTVAERYLAAQGLRDTGSGSYVAERDRYARLATELQAVVETRPGRREAAQSALAGLAAGNKAGALAFFQAIKDESGHGPLTSKRARANAARQIAALLWDENLLTASGELREAVALDPDNSSAWLELGEAEMERGSASAAEVAFRRLVGIVEARQGATRANDDETALAQERLAATLVLLGRAGEAATLYEKALELRVELSRRDPASAERVAAIAATHLALGEVLACRGRSAAAEQHFIAALQMTTPRESAEATDIQDEAGRLHARALDRIGDLRRQDGNIAEARALYEQALDIRRGVTGSSSAIALWQIDVAASFNRLGEIARQEGAFNDALDSHQNALRIIERLAIGDRIDPDRQADIARTRELIGDAFEARGRHASALFHYEDALAVRRRVSALNPDNLDARRELGIGLRRIGDSLVEGGDLEEARERYEQAYAVARQLKDAGPDNTLWQRDHALAAIALGDILARQDRNEEALSRHGEAIGLFRAVARRYPADRDWQHDLAGALAHAATTLTALGRFAAAEERHRESLAIRQEIAAAEPDNSLWHRELAFGFLALGDTLRAEGHGETALARYREALTFLEMPAAASGSETPAARRDLMTVLSRLGDLLADLGRFGEAHARQERALAIAQRLAEDTPDSFTALRDLAAAQERIGDLFLRQGRLGEAEVSCRAALSLREELTLGDPTRADWQVDLAKAYTRLARAVPDTAVEYRFSAIDILDRLDSEGQLPPHYRDFLIGLRKAVSAAQPIVSQ